MKKTLNNKMNSKMNSKMKVSLNVLVAGLEKLFKKKNNFLV